MSGCFEPVAVRRFSLQGGRGEGGGSVFDEIFLDFS